MCTPVCLLLVMSGKYPNQNSSVFLLRACMRACVRACVRACICEYWWFSANFHHGIGGPPRNFVKKLWKLVLDLSSSCLCSMLLAFYAAVCPAQTFITIVSGVNGTSNPVVWLAVRSNASVSFAVLVCVQAIPYDGNLTLQAKDF